MSFSRRSASSPRCQLKRHLMGASGGQKDKRFSRISIFLETLNGRLPLKHSSDWPQTLPKRVSDDPRHFIFRRRTKKNRRIFRVEKLFFRYFGRVFEELRPNGPQNQIRRQILL